MSERSRPDFDIDWIRAMVAKEEELGTLPPGGASGGFGAKRAGEVNDERFWWTMVVRAQEQEAQALSRDPRDMDEWLASHEVEMQARGELVKLGLNLDELMPAADDEFLARYRAVKQREQCVAEQRQRRDELVKAAEALLARIAQ